MPFDDSTAHDISPDTVAQQYGHTDKPSKRPNPFKLLDAAKAALPAFGPLGAFMAVPPQHKELVGGLAAGIPATILGGPVIGAGASGIGATIGRGIGQLEQGEPVSPGDLAKTAGETAGRTLVLGGIAQGVGAIPGAMANKFLPSIASGPAVRYAGSAAGGAAAGAIGAPPGERLKGAATGAEFGIAGQAIGEGIGGYRRAHKFDPEREYTPKQLKKFPENVQKEYYRRKQVGVAEESFQRRQALRGERQLTLDEIEAQKQTQLAHAADIKSSKLAALRQEQADLTQALAGTAEKPGLVGKRVTEIRARLPQMLKDGSDEYMSIARGSIIKAGNPSIELADLDATWKAALVDDPVGLQRAEATLKRLAGSAEMPRTQISSLEAFDASRALRGNVAPAARAGRVPYSHNDTVASKMAAGVVDTMATKGADVGAAKEFYSQFAPLREGAIKTIGLSKNPNLNLDPGSAAVEAAARNEPTDPARIVKQLETRLGVPFTKDLAEKFAHLDANTQAQILTEADKAFPTRIEDVASRRVADAQELFLGKSETIRAHRNLRSERLKQEAALTTELTRRARWLWGAIRAASVTGGVLYLGGNIYRNIKRMANNVSGGGGGGGDNY